MINILPDKIPVTLPAFLRAVTQIGHIESQNLPIPFTSFTSLIISLLYLSDRDYDRFSLVGKSLLGY